jgi:hypothetical protein
LNGKRERREVNGISEKYRAGQGNEAGGRGDGRHPDRSSAGHWRRTMLSALRCLPLPKDEEISTHTSEGDAMVLVLEGCCGAYRRRR